MSTPYNNKYDTHEFLRSKFNKNSFQGHPRLINAISSLYTKFLNRSPAINPQKEVLVTDGAYEALFCAIMGNVNEGDEVIIIEPYFDCYEPMVRLAGGTPRFISLAPKVQIIKND